MKRSAPMRPGKPLQRSGFKQQARAPRAPQPLYQLARPCRVAVISATAVPVPKAAPVHSEPYRRLVASLPCIACGIEGFSNHAHGNVGKGMALKNCDLFSFPLCVDRPGEVGCHSKLDQGAMFARAPRRVIEVEWARRTVLFLVSAGRWPASAVPDWAAA
jgi:hypothetical protein